MALRRSLEVSTTRSTYVNFTFFPRSGMQVGLEFLGDRAWTDIPSTLPVVGAEFKQVWDIRKRAILYSLQGHTDTISSLSLSPSGSHLLSYAFDSTLIIHDVKPFSPSPSRIHRVLEGQPAGFEGDLARCDWSRDDGGRRVAVGGGDRAVTVWDVESSEVLYRLPGHKGSVTTAAFHPREPILLTGSKDKTMLLGEIEPSS